MIGDGGSDGVCDVDTDACTEVDVGAAAAAAVTVVVAAAAGGADVDAGDRGVIG